MRYVAPGDEDQKAPNLNRKQHGKQQAVRAVADSLRFVVTCSGVGVQRHVTLVRIGYPNAMRLPGTQIMAVSVPVRPPPVPPPACSGS